MVIERNMTSAHKNYRHQGESLDESIRERAAVDRFIKAINIYFVFVSFKLA